MNYYLGPWRWITDADGSYWGPPLGAVASIDVGGGANRPGLGFFACTSPLLDLDYLDLGTGLGQTLGGSQLAKWRTALRLDKLAGTRLLHVLVETLTTQADPAGIVRAKPIIPCTNGYAQIVLQGHGVVWDDRFTGEADPKWPNIQGVLRATYRRVREQALAAGTEAHRRLLACWIKKYRIDDPRAFIPEDLPIEAARPPHTIYTDDFNRVNNDDPGANWAEVDGDWDIVSNTIRAPVDTPAGSYPSSARYAQELSTDDHYAEIDWVYAASTGAYVGAACRFAAAAETCYAGFVRESAGYRYIGKIIAGTWTGLENDLLGTAPPHTIRLTVNGSTLTLFQDAGQILQTSDTDITGNLRAGLIAHSAELGGGDNFETADLPLTAARSFGVIIS